MPKNSTSELDPVFDIQISPLGSTAKPYGTRRSASNPYPVEGESGVPGLLEFDPDNSENVW